MAVFGSVPNTASFNNRNMKGNSDVDVVVVSVVVDVAFVVSRKCVTAAACKRHIVLLSNNNANDCNANVDPLLLDKSSPCGGWIVSTDAGTDSRC